MSKTKITFELPLSGVKKIMDDPEAFKRYMAENGMPIESVRLQVPVQFQDTRLKPQITHERRTKNNPT